MDRNRHKMGRPLAGNDGAGSKPFANAGRFNGFLILHDRDQIGYTAKVGSRPGKYIIIVVL